MLTFLVLSLIWRLISKPKKATVLYCGIWGFCGNRRIDERILDKLKMLGFFNQARGTDSCGYYNGEVIGKGVDKLKEWYHYVVDENVELPEDSNIFIGHTRKATKGICNMENAHPFEIDDKLIMVHNGTIENAFSMCTENDIDIKEVNVDSLALGLLVDKLGWKILEKYKGFAALLVAKTDEPGALYVYHGKSKQFESTQPEEERPLFYLEAEEGIYFSSLEHSLAWINGKKDPDKIKEVPHNKVIKVLNGKATDEIIPIDRIRTNIYKYTPAVNPPNTGYYNNVKKHTIAIPLGNTTAIPLPGLDIEKETTPLKASVKIPSIYYHKGRYWRSSDHSLCEGVIQINKKGEIVPMTDLHQKRVEAYWFYQGVMLKSERKYQEIKEKMGEEHSIMYGMLTRDDLSFAVHISEYAAYPVCNINGESSRVHLNRKAWYLNGKFATGAITPKFSNRNYHIKSGVLVKVGAEEKDRPVFTYTDNKCEGAAVIQNAFEFKKEEVDKEGRTFDDFIKQTANLGKDKQFEGLSKILSYSEEVMNAAKPLHAVHQTENEAEEAIVGLSYRALELYASDVAKTILKTADTKELVEKLITEAIRTAVYTGTSIEGVAEPQLNHLIEYVNDAYYEWVEKKAEEESEAEGEKKEKDPEDMSIAERLQESANEEDVKEESIMSGAKVIDMHSKDGKTFEAVDDNDGEDEYALQFIHKALDFAEELDKLQQQLYLLTNCKFARDFAFEIDLVSDELIRQMMTNADKHKLQDVRRKAKTIQNIY